MRREREYAGSRPARTRPQAYALLRRERWISGPLPPPFTAELTVSPASAGRSKAQYRRDFRARPVDGLGRVHGHLALSTAHSLQSC